MPRAKAGARASPYAEDKAWCSCPVDAAFGIFGRKWSLQIVRNLIQGDHHFNQILEHTKGLNPKTLSQRLKEMERSGLVAKKIVSKNPVKIEYHLSEKGHAILPVLLSMARWSFEWAGDEVFRNGRSTLTVEECVEQWRADLLGSQRELGHGKAGELARAAPGEESPPRRPT